MARASPYRLAPFRVRPSPSIVAATSVAGACNWRRSARASRKRRSAVAWSFFDAWRSPSRCRVSARARVPSPTPTPAAERALEDLDRGVVQAQVAVDPRQRVEQRGLCLRIVRELDRDALRAAIEQFARGNRAAAPSGRLGQLEEVGDEQYDALGAGGFDARGRTRSPPPLPGRRRVANATTRAARAATMASPTRWRPTKRRSR